MQRKRRSQLSNLVLLAGILTASGCTGLFSGGASIPVGPSDHKLIEDAQYQVFAPNIFHQDQPDRPPIVLGYAFDGTLNDQQRIPEGERQTIVSYIAERVPGMHYYPGVGMQGKRIDAFDAALGRSMVSTAERASKTLFAQIDQVLQVEPNSEIRVFVTGFSRGAASARHFMNIVDEQWRERQRKQGASHASLRFYALLYDSVSTGPYSGVRLGLPGTVNYSLHFVARDEARPLFPVDIDMSTAREAMADAFVPRINTLYLPGAHSDVGASYAVGLGDNYRMLTDETLFALGLIKENCFENTRDSTLDGKHDSRGVLDKLLGAPVAGRVVRIDRPSRAAIPAPLDDAEYADIQESLERLAAANANRLTMRLTVDSTTLGFTARRKGESLSLLGVSNLLDPSVTQLVSDDAGHVKFEYGYRMLKTPTANVLPLSRKVVERIQVSGSAVDVTLSHIPQGLRFNIFVDGIWVDHVDHKVLGSTPVNPLVRCETPDERVGKM
ncbi:DUF2235 domain-containing protein [Pseudomonas plecoglossicida]|uniref:DUF2235 domain-containing protein n=1 Tax=Pseudomonas plecoglossicida TaxID=70775 RepID=A0AAD0QSE9_PSEDL|nr:DUF2235 domain-containing protein [Pseudomonas plecoglossicida]AXM94835.1 hypothetical protein DVB73_02855 [Pseudomonas plecoglossicida]QLB55576.1 hypothetical protein HAV28_12400 [Pseudomonas plecoglossicida]